jgi:hypothetical protein
MAVPAQQHRERVERTDDALKLDAIDEEYGYRKLVLTDVVEENVLYVL